MDLKYSDVIYIVKNYLTKEECEQLIEEYESNKDFSYQEDSTNYITSSNEVAKSTIVSLTPGTGNYNLVHTRAEKFITEWIDHLDSYKSFFTEILKLNLNYANNYRILKYETGGYIHPHIDWTYFTHASLTFNLNDGYEGGEFCFFNGKNCFKLGVGDAIIFPADCFWVHEVTPIISGTRYSMNVNINSIPRKYSLDITEQVKWMTRSPDIIDYTYYKNIGRSSKFQQKHRIESQRKKFEQQIEKMSNKSMEIITYTLSGCSHCKTIKELFRRAGTNYTEVVVKQDMSLDEFSSRFPHVTTFPFVVVNEKEIGGLVETVKLFVAEGLVSSTKNKNGSTN